MTGALVTAGLMTLMMCLILAAAAFIVGFTEAIDLMDKLMKPMMWVMDKGEQVGRLMNRKRRR